MKDTNTISLVDVLDEAVPFAFDLSFSAAALEREPLLEISRVRFEGQVVRVEGGFALDGEIAYRGMLECSRCLEPYRFDAGEEFSLLLYKSGPRGGSEVSLEKGDLDVSFYEGTELPVRPIVEERIQMAVPMKPLCREECLGLCVRCGRDRNLGDCGCAAEATDLRWDALKRLKKV